MKRKRLTYDNWTCIRAKTFHACRFEGEDFCGQIALLQIAKVSKPQIWHVRKKKVTVCRNGFQWLSILPDCGGYCITAILNEKRRIVLWYLDMIDTHGLDTDGVPYFDDLYLDLIVLPDGTIYEDDRDELEDALKQGNITDRQFADALDTSRRLQLGLLADLKVFTQFTYRCGAVIGVEPPNIRL